VPPLKIGRPDRRDLWRSLDALADAPEFRRFVEQEFPHAAEAMLAAPSRRSFLKYMGASVALAGMSGCRWPAEEILPFARRPPGSVPGEPVSYATAMELGGVALGLLVTSYDGRPIKVEGNPAHPASRGGTSAWAQASLLELYDPQRATRIVRREGGAARELSFDEFDRFAAEHFGRLRQAGGRGLAVLAEASDSPSLAAGRERYRAAFPAAAWYEYEPLSRDAEREGARLAFGRALRPVPRLARAELVVSLDEDFLYAHPAAVRLAREFAEARDPTAGRSCRLWVAETCYSTTGSRADRRVPLPAQMIPVLAGCLAANLLLEHGLDLGPGSAELVRMLERFQAHPYYTELPAGLAAELIEHRGRGLLLAGPRQPPAVHALLAVLNHALGHVGTTLEWVDCGDDARATHVAAIEALARELSAGAVDTLLILGGNPAYDAPADLEFARALTAVPTSIHLGVHDDETSAACRYHLPRAHYLESWGDTRDWEGRISIVQPLIEPLHGGRTAIETLARIAGAVPHDAHALVRETFGLPPAGAGDEQAWREALREGVVAASAWPLVEAAPATAGWSDQLAPFLRTHARLAGAAAELVFVPSAATYDGRFANNGWLQELPDPLTKLTWDNAALVGPGTAAELGVRQGDMLRVETARAALELPVYVMPGQARGTIGVALGYGRTRAGEVGSAVGVDAYALRTAAAWHWAPVRATRADGHRTLATTQDHFAIDPLGAREADERSRVLAREVDAGTPHPHAGAAEAHGPGPAGHGEALFPAWEYAGHRWGMAIDLDACTGCNACVVACQAENNIPVVGPAEVARGREMHWLRVDRYFRGEPEAPAVMHQPLTCQHCENAPCEQVCPVGATVHDAEGLNVMVYNRCVGTRYCANNCPYKVRRFNYFNNHAHDAALALMIYNPEVSVRSRGVMEKCTFCVQRIQRAKIAAGNAGRRVADGDVVTACEQACPTRAIVFGDLADPHSRVHRAHADRRAYGLLDWLGTRPRTRYLARVRHGAPDETGAG